MAANRSLSLAAYRALTRRAPAPVKPAWPKRPAGELAWVHLGSQDDQVALFDLADHLVQVRGDLTVLVTHDADDFDTIHPQTPIRADLYPMIQTDVPDEHPDAVDAFLDHWHPDVGMWVWGRVRPNLVDHAHTRDIPLHMVSADKPGFDGLHDTWLADMMRHVMGCFETASARSAAGAQRLARVGMPADRIIVQPALRPAGRVLPFAPSDLDEIALSLQGRAVWLGAALEESEWRIVLDAHRLALRSAHRLLLVLNIERPDILSDITAALQTEGLTYQIWSDGACPDETTQVLIADLPDELGLWYRVASVSFQGGTLGAGSVQDPMAAAALGTAILYGPSVQAHQDSYARLAHAGAAHLVRDAHGLGNMVAAVIPPEVSATMAHAGWDVATEGAESVDAVIDLVQDSLDARLAQRAPEATP